MGMTLFLLCALTNCTMTSSDDGQRVCPIDTIASPATGTPTAPMQTNATCTCCKYHGLSGYHVLACPPPYPYEYHEHMDTCEGWNVPTIELPLYDNLSDFFRCAVLPWENLPLVNGRLIVPIGDTQRLMIPDNVHVVEGASTAKWETARYFHLNWTASPGVVLPENVNAAGLRTEAIWQPGEFEPLIIPQPCDGMAQPQAYFPTAGEHTVTGRVQRIFGMAFQEICDGCKHPYPTIQKPIFDETATDTLNVTVVKVDYLTINNASRTLVGNEEHWLAGTRTIEQYLLVKVVPNPILDDRLLPDDWTVTFTGPNGQALPAGQVRPKLLPKENENDPDEFSRTEFYIDQRNPAIYNIRAKCGTSSISTVLYVAGVRILNGAATINRPFATLPTKKIAGEPIALYAAIVPEGLPFIMQQASQQWSASGHLVKDYIANNQSGTVVPWTQADATSNPTAFYWTRAGDQLILFSCLIGGQRAYTEAPVTVVAPYATGNALPAAVSDAPICYTYQVTGLRFYYGMEFGVPVRWPTGYSGDSDWVQLTKSQRRWPARIEGGGFHNMKIQAAEYLLDTRFTYEQSSTEPALQGTVSMDDHPVTVAHVNGRRVSIIDDFRAHLLAKPSVPHAIWIPVGRKVEWGGRIQATNGGFGGGPPAWTLSQMSLTTPSEAIDFTLPVWSDNIEGKTEEDTDP